MPSLISRFITYKNRYSAIKEHGGAVEACRGHIPEVNGSKPFPEIIFICFALSILVFCLDFFRLLSWPSWLVRRTYKQCRSICEGGGFDPLREQVFTSFL